MCRCVCGCVCRQTSGQLSQVLPHVLRWLELRKATHPIDRIYSRLCVSLSGSLSSSLQMVHVQLQRAFNISKAGVGVLSCHLFNFCLC